MQKHPEIDFDNPSKQDKETIDDALDVIMYADNITDSMKAAIEETNRRRANQESYNEENGLIP